jgi:hypothetical protein
MRALRGSAGRRHADPHGGNAPEDSSDGRPTRCPPRHTCLTVCHAHASSDPANGSGCTADPAQPSSTWSSRVTGSTGAGRRHRCDTLTAMAERASFGSTRGPRLAGLLDLPEGPVRGFGVFLHGFTLGKDLPAAARICQGLAADGICMLGFDDLGLGESEGEWGDGSSTHKVADTGQAAAFVAEGGTPVDLLVGHSFGGAAVLAAARQVSGLDAVVTIGAPADPGHVEHHDDGLVERGPAEGRAEWVVGGRALTLRLSR